MYTKYPEIQVQDVVKLLYQSEFGGGHMIADEGKSLERIREESLKIPKRIDDNRQNFINKEMNSWEDIGDGISRIYLTALQDGLREETLNRMFVLTARWKKGTTEGFERKLQELVSCCESGELSFDADELRKYLHAYKERGYPAVSHSDVYRELYQPSYRIADEKFARYYPVFLAIDRAMTRNDGGQNKQLTVAIDGMCGAGKSTLGQLLKQVYDCSLFHMDDFFLRPEQRTPERFAEPGGNVDYERFRQEVLDHLADAEGLSYQVFDCGKWSLGERIYVPCRKLNIVEGSYSQHPYFGNVYDLRFFCGIDPEEQLKRIERRNGPDMLERFRNEWIPMENRYLEHCRIAEKSILL